MHGYSPRVKLALFHSMFPSKKRPKVEVQTSNVQSPLGEPVSEPQGGVRCEQ